jgi:SNF2 family DNA or RNA helicase
LAQKKRAEVLEEFKKNPKIQVFLISLKAGGVGLNLTVANHAFLVDPWWNPAVEEQAVERVHRIGQKKDVEVVRFICRETIEERIIELHEQKKDLFNSTITLNQEDRKNLNIENFKYLMKNYH